MDILKARTITEAFSKVSQFVSNWAINNPPYCWFRGTSDSDLCLLPGAYWRTNYDETLALFEFVQGGSGFSNVGPADSWAAYCLAQHHGLPTRLLDWTESFAAAMFFAFDNWNEETVPCIWILQPCLLNECVLNYHGVLGPENIPELKIWLNKDIYRNKPKVIQDHEGFTYDNEKPLAIVPKRSNSRITIQQGMFTIHGRDNSPLDRLIQKNNGRLTDQLARLDFTFSDRNKSRSQALRELALYGIRRSAIYPDLDNFVKQIGEEQGW